ncbi:uncharacterized protein V6R79_003660 [Siganus canaliculatus]
MGASEDSLRLTVAALQHEVLAAHGGGDPGVLVLVFLFVCCVSPAFDRVCVFNVISRLIRVSSFGILTPSSHPLTTAVTGATPRSQLLQADPVLNLPGPSGDAGAVADVPPANVAVQPAAPPDVAVCRSFTAVAAKPCAPHVCDLHLIGRYWQLTVVVILVSWCWFSSLCAVKVYSQKLFHKGLKKSAGKPPYESTVDFMVGQPQAITDLAELYIKVCETVIEILAVRDFETEE